MSECDEAPHVEVGAGAPVDPGFDEPTTAADPPVGAVGRAATTPCTTAELPSPAASWRGDVVDAVAALVDDLVDGPDDETGEDRA